jgi:hypothetical protein
MYMHAREISNKDAGTDAYQSAI